MKKSEESSGADPIASNLYAFSESSAPAQLAETPHLTQQDLAEISELMNSLARLREAELLLSEASRKYMRLSTQDMRALHYLIVAKRQGRMVTPSMIAAHLRISAASTTKLLSRLEKGGHIVRHIHPSDRRAFVIEVTPETQASAQETVGQHQARRFSSAARLTSDERAVVTRFLDDMTERISLKNARWAQEPETP